MALNPEYPDTTLAYLAGIVDADCSLTIQRVNGQYASFHSKMSVANTDARLVEWLQDTFGGRVHWGAQRNGNRKPLNQWYIHRGEVIYDLLKVVLPYLVIKREQATNLIELCEAKQLHGVGRGGQIAPMEYESQAEYLLEDNKVLNAKGTN